MSTGGTPAGNTTQTQTAPAYMLPYMGTAAGQAANLLGSGGPNYYSGQQVASFNPLQNQAFSGIQSLAGSNPFGAATRYNNNLLQGRFSRDGSDLANLQQMGTGSMNNPELGNLLNLQNQGIENNVASQFAGSGRDVFQSLPVQQQQMGNADSSLLSNAYNINQGNALAANQTLAGLQQGAVGNAQNLVGARLGLQGALGNVGNQVQQQGQSLIDASKNAYNYSQQQPFQNLGQFESFLSGLQPGSQTVSPFYTNPAATGLGAALAGKQLFGGSKGGSTAAAAGGA